MAKHWKKYLESAKLVDNLQKYTMEEAVSLVKKVSYTKFVAGVEAHIKTFADPRYNDQMLRWTVVLPHGNGKSVKVWVFASDDKIEEARAAWADIVGWNDLLKKIEEGVIEFDVLVTTPDMMRDLAKVAKTLWPKGLMPSPKAGTVATDLKATINEIKKWRIEFKLDKTGNLHVLIGKVNFEEKQLQENLEAFMKAIEEAKPAWVKWKLVKKLVVAPTMGPWVQIAY